MEEKFDLPVEVEAEPRSEPAEESVGVFLFQAVRELLFNVVKHARAGEAKVTLQRRGETEVRVEVSDDGIGLDRERVEAKAGKLRVLLADDHPIVRTGLADMLRELQEVASVVEARDGQEAVELATQIRPDLVVMDITMPRLNGIEATRRIKTLLPGARVIGLSMHDTVEMTRAMRDAGAVECLRKDAASDELIVSILSQAGRS